MDLDFSQQTYVIDQLKETSGHIVSIVTNMSNLLSAGGQPVPDEQAQYQKIIDDNVARINGVNQMLQGLIDTNKQYL